MPKIPRLSTKLPKIPSKVDTSLRNNGQGTANEGEGEVRPEQIAAANQLKSMAAKAVSPYIEGVKRIFKSLPSATPQSLPAAGGGDGIMSNMEKNKKRLRDAMNGKF